MPLEIVQFPKGFKWECAVGKNDFGLVFAKTGSVLQY